MEGLMRTINGMTETDYNRQWKKQHPHYGRDYRRSQMKMDPIRREYLDWLKTLTDEQKVRNNQLKFAYGITLREYDVLLEQQGGVCAICGGKGQRGLCVDHNHTTGEIRKLLCNSCNFILGYAKEDITILQRTIDYLQAYTNKK